MSPLQRSTLKWVATISTLALLLALAWQELTRVRGVQVVHYQAAAKRCGQQGPLRYCVFRAAGGVNQDIVYHLHGRNLDEQAWNDETYLTGMLQAHWQSAGLPPPTVVSVSYGPVWLLAPRGARPDSGLLEDLILRLDEIERDIGPPRRRMLLGESMGGLNALILGLSQPQRFSKVAALCPGVYVDSPFASLSVMQQALERTGAQPRIAFGVVMLARRYFADDVEWQRASPLSLVERSHAGFPELYLSVGLYDAYGNFEGTQALARRAQSLGIKTEWHPIYGGHCASDIASVGNFLLR